MTLDPTLIAPSPGDAVVAKLEDPRVAAALCDLLEHADLLAVLVTGLDAMIRRGDTITGGLAKAVGDWREAMAETAGDGEPVDLTKLASSLRTLSAAVSDATPGLEALFRSALTDPRAVDVASSVARSIIAGAEAAKREPAKPMGAFALLRTLKDEDVARGLNFLIHVARAFGRELKES
jgi:hypothetical protein